MGNTATSKKGDASENGTDWSQVGGWIVGNADVEFLAVVFIGFWELLRYLMM